MQGSASESVAERRQRGLEVYSSQFQLPINEVEPFMVERFGRLLTEEALVAAGGGTWDPDRLSLRDRSLVVLTALTALGGTEARMRPHVRWALEHGLTAEEIEAAVSMLAVYVGYPRAAAAAELIHDELRRLGEEG